MKLKYIIASFIAAASVLVGCVKENPIAVLEGLSVSNDYVTLAADENASVSITVNGEEAWTASVPDAKATWLSLSPTSGSAGQNVSLTFTATASSAARSTEVYIVMGGKTKIVKVNQEAPVGVEVPPSTVKEIMEGPDKNYRVTGTVMKITNTHYGNWYINDGTVEGDGLYIYGTLDKKGGDNNSSNKWDNLNDPSYANSWTLAVGDKVTIEGPRSVYNGTVELVNVTILKIEPSLIQVEAFDFDKLPAEETTFDMVVTAKESPLLINSDADWLQIVSVNADGSYKLHADANLRTAERTANISISGPTARKSVSITQMGVPATGASVSEIIAMDDNSQVQTLPSTVVVALTTKGAVLSDGAKAIYAYDDKAAALKLGDGVSMSAKKTTYNGVPELTTVTDVFVDSEGNAVNHPDAVDITSQAGTYAATEAEYVKLTGTLSVSGNYLNILLDEFPEGDRQGSIVNPVDELNAKSFDGKKITVTGYFNGISGKGKYINVIATKIVEAVDNPKGTVTNPYLASEIAKLLTGGETIDENVYIKGKVCAILYPFSANFGTGTFWLSDDGTSFVSADYKKTDDPTHDFVCYSVYWFDNQPWADGNGQVEIGDEVVVYGKTTVYNGVAETSSKKAWVYSVNGATTDANGLGNASFPFNVAGAEAFIDRMEAAKAAAAENDEPAPTFPDVCVKGKISSILYSFSANFGTATFWISDDGVAYGVSGDKKSTTEPSKDFECYGLYWYNNTPWAEGNDQIAEGDEVIVKGQLTMYKTTYETSNKKAWMYSLNGKTE